MCVYSHSVHVRISAHACVCVCADIYGHFLVSAEQASTGVGVNPEVFVEGSIPEWAKEGEGADLMCNAEECYKYKDILPLGACVCVCVCV
jgi:hypothetical protein